MYNGTHVQTKHSAVHYILYILFAYTVCIYLLFACISILCTRLYSSGMFHRHGRHQHISSSVKLQYPHFEVSLKIKLPGQTLKEFPDARNHHVQAQRHYCLRGWSANNTGWVETWNTPHLMSYLSTLNDWGDSWKATALLQIFFFQSLNPHEDGWSLTDWCAPQKGSNKTCPDSHKQVVPPHTATHAHTHTHVRTRTDYCSWGPPRCGRHRTTQSACLRKLFSLQST